MGFVGLLAIVLLALASRPLDRGAAAKRTRCLNNIRNIGLALRQYHKDHGCFPPAYVTAKDGTPLYSWRVLVVGYLDQPDIARKFHYDEPWNSPHNLALATALPIFCCPKQSDEPSAMTNYLAVVGEQTCWPGADSRSLDEIIDGPQDTILLVEVADSGILWTEPRDLFFEQLQLDEAAPINNRPSSHHPAVFLVAVANGSARPISKLAPPEKIKAVLTINGGEPIDLDTDL
jgi:hypothetical protein